MTTRPTRRTGPARRSSGALFLALLLGVLGPAVAAAPASAQSAADRAAAAWTDLPSSAPAARRGAAPEVDPARFRALGLDRDALADVLGDAPRAAPGTASRATGLTITLPAPDGRDHRFRITRSAVLAPELAAEHPEIATYAGVGVDEKGATVRLDLTPAGFHASVRGPSGSWYVDPRFRGDQSVYASYRGSDLENRHGPFQEGEVQAVDRALRREVAPRPAGQVVPVRTYRLALLNDSTYAAYFGGTDAQVLAAKTTLITRVNQIYEDDFAITLQLIAGSGTTLNLGTAARTTGANGPCGARACFTPEQAAGCDVPTLDRTRTVLGQLVGASSYDVGHLVLGVDGGGVAYRGWVGDDLKGGGCTGVPTPVGDAFAVDYVAHELGHQFDGDHTFNGTLVNCAAPNRAAAQSVEPGSGSTIMGYAGICGADDLQSNSDPYFSQRSIDQITAYADGAAVPVSEGQSVSLGSFDAGDRFQLTYGGQASAAIVRGTNDDAAGIRNAIQAIPGLSGVTVTSLDDASSTVGPAGFHARFGGALAGTDVPSFGVTGETGGVTVVVGEATQGGPSRNGGALTTSGNRAPVVTAAPNTTIPARTPFGLTGSATDADGDALTYLWEQNDPGGATGTLLATELKPNGPLFRVFGTIGTIAAPNAAGTSPTRIFPDLAQVVAGTTNQVTGTCTGSAAAVRDCRSEFLPTAPYAGPMHFRLTARDGAVGAGGVAHADTTLAVDTAAGPFRVTAPTGGTTVPGGTAVTATWSVNGTNTGAIDVQDVRITLSTDGGVTFPTVLESSTPNDGSHAVTVPNVATPAARLRIEAVGNVFFDVSHANFSITAAPGTSAPTVGNDAPAGRTQVQHTDALSPVVTITANDVDTGGGALEATATGLPTGLGVTAVPGSASGTGTGGSPGARSWTVSGAVDAAPGTYAVTLAVADGTGRTGTTAFDVVVAAEDAAATYTGDTTVASAAGAATATATLRADVSGAVPGDATPGDVSAATVTFREGGTTLCTDVPVATAGVPGAPGAGRASCAATLTAGADHPVTVVVGGRYGATASGAVGVTATPAEPTPTTPTTPETPPAPDPPVTPGGPATPTTPTTPTTPPSPLDPGARIPPVTSAVARLQPVLSATAKRLRVSRTGRVPVRIRCRTSGTGTAAATCSGTVRITAKLGGRTRTVGTATFRITPTATRTVNVRLSASARRTLGRATKATVTATVTNGSRGTLKASRGVTLVPRR